MRVLIPSPLRSYTGGRDEVDLGGSNLAELLTCLDQEFPGIRFRMIDEQDGIRKHIQIFVGEEKAKDLSAPLTPQSRVQIVCALSGG